MRLKIIAGNLLIVALTGAVSFFLVHPRLEQGLLRGLDVRLANQQMLFERSWLFLNQQFLTAVEQQAASAHVHAVFSALDEKSRRRAANIASEQIGQAFQSDDARQAPDLVLVADETGRVIARDKDVNRMFGQSLTDVLPSLLTVIKSGNSHFDIWWKRDENKLLRTAVAPVRGDQGAVVGAVVVAYDLSNGFAKGEAKLLGRDLVFVMPGKVYSSSLPGTEAKELGAHLFGTLKTETARALHGESMVPQRIDVAERSYLAVIGPLHPAASAKVAFALLADRHQELDLASIAYLILLTTLVGLVLAAIYGFVVGSSLMRPIEQIEEGILAVINGKSAMRLEVEGPEFGGLAYRINQLINTFTGTADPDERGHVTIPPGVAVASIPAWQGAAFRGTSVPREGVPREGLPGIVENQQLVAKLAALEEKDYLEQLYAEYRRAKTANGESVEQVEKQSFFSKVQKDAERMAEQHKVKRVRFHVQSANGQVDLMPVLIR